MEVEEEGCVIDVSTWNGGSGSGVVHCWLAFPVEEVCCYLERGGGAGRVLFVVGVPGGSGRCSRWKGRWNMVTEGRSTGLPRLCP